VSLGQALVSANTLKTPVKAQRAGAKAAAAIEKDERSEAERQLARALQIAPDYVVALTLRAILEMDSQISASIADLEHAIRVDPTYGAAYAVLASVYNDSGRYEGAFPIVSRAVQLLPGASQVRYEMARTLFGQHKHAEALAELANAARANEMDPQAGAESRAAIHCFRGRILMAQREFPVAKLEFELALREDPRGKYANISNLGLARLQSLGNH
jgi:tetratricopeptide (TPR) repeat protein